MEFILYFNIIVSVLFFICYAYQVFYVFVPFFKKERPHKETKMHRYAVLICARNESAVIADLVNSINAQDYPSRLITTFVMADNCTDNTAEIARNAGAQVYERFNKQLVGKGYAMDVLLKNIHRDWGEDAFDAFVVFDADNVLCEDYITNLNVTFSDGYDIITTYRNSKNWGENWISAGYALWFMRESRFLNLPRHILSANAGVSGTGFMFSDKVLRETGGWPFHLLTEDIEFTINSVLRGYRIGYCHNGVFFDEQPVKFSQSFTQRMRWAKGVFQVFGRYGLDLFKGALKGDFSCYDMTMNLMPAVLLAFVSVLVNGTACFMSVITGRRLDVIGLGIAMWLYNMYTMFLAIGAVTLLTQWKRIYAPRHKKVMYLFTFPLFMMTYIPISIAALFVDVQWKQIAHTDSKNLSAIINTK